MCSEDCRTSGELQHPKAWVLFGICSFWQLGVSYPVPLDSPQGFTARTSVLRWMKQKVHLAISQDGINQG